MGIGTLLTLYCLFGPDMIVASTSSDSTFARDVLTLVALLFFVIEMVLAMIGSPSYLTSFFFLLDAVCVGTLILDLSWVGTGLMTGAVSKASRASRAGTRATRVVRIIRLVRLFRISKMFKVFLKKDPASPVEFQDDDCDEPDEVPMQYGQETELGKRLSHRTSQRVILMVLLLMFVTPQLEASAHMSPGVDLVSTGLAACNKNYFRFVNACRSGDANLMRVTRQLYDDSVVSFVLYACNGITDCGSDHGTGIAWIGAAVANTSDPCLVGENGPGTVSSSSRLINEVLSSRLSLPWSENCSPDLLSSFGVSLSLDLDCPATLTDEQRSLATTWTSDADEAWLEVIVDRREYVRADALMSIYRTLAICAILAVGIFVFSQGAFVMVLEPIERMLAKVEKIRENPLLAIKLDNDTIKKAEQERLKRIARFNTATNPLSRWVAKRRLAQLSQSTLETDTLEKTIMRIGGLLAVGFGQAGAEIVAHNMTSTAAGINAMVPGRRIDAIFACIHVENFSNISAALQDKVMVFVNQLSEIVHGIADEFHGMANKTNGDSFLMVWRLTGDASKDIKLHDMAIAACIKIEIAIRRSLELFEYRRLPPLMPHLGGKRVELKYGLHRGWAIEGAIGSNLKIDPSYLGPDVNVAESIGLLNTDYDATFLASESVVNSCTMKALFRCIDYIKLRSAGDALNLFVLDIDTRAELLTDYEIEHALLTTTTHGNKNRQRRERAKRKEQRWSTDMSTLLSKDKFFALLRQSFDPMFAATFEKGFLNYQAGEWTVAHDSLNEYCAGDGPSRNLLRFMESHAFVPPVGWDGIRYYD